MVMETPRNAFGSGFGKNSRYNLPHNNKFNLPKTMREVMNRRVTDNPLYGIIHGDNR
jgi:hypothetical protein